MVFNRKQIWLVNFDPSVGHEYRKVRPALIIGDSRYTQTGNLVTLIPISSKVDKQFELDVYLSKDTKNRLMKDSLIKTKQISSFDKQRFIKYIGNCNEKVFGEVLENVKKYFSIDKKGDRREVDSFTPMPEKKALMGNSMGKPLEKVTVKNFGDILNYSQGKIKEDEIRAVEIEALVDTGAAYLCLPPAVIEKLGLLYSHTRGVNTANGKVERRIFYGAVIIIQGRDIQMQVMENDATTPPLIGYLVLEAMDFVVDPEFQKILPNPAHDGKWVIDLY